VSLKLLLLVAWVAVVPAVARAFIIFALLAATVSCRRDERPDALMIPDAAADDSQWSRVVVHATLDTPVGVKISPGVALLTGRANYGGLLPAPGFERVDAFPVQRRCRRGSMCAVSVRQRLMTVVFAFDPVVEVDLAMPEDGARVSFPRYRDPESTSAALAKVYEQSAALEWVCLDHRLERAERLSQARRAEAVLRQTAAQARRGVVRRAADLALVQGQCTGAAANRAIAEQLLDTLQPTAPELSLWTDALSKLGSLARDSGRARALVDAVIEQHPQPAVGARLLFLRLHGLGDDADPHVVEELLRRLASPRFAKTTPARLANSLDRVRNAVALRPNDRLPDLEFSGLGGEAIRTPDSGARLELLYFSASWCDACIKSLPKMRALARAHPEVRIVYVLFDGLNDARQFAKQHAPVPGEIAWTTPDERQGLHPRVFRYAMLPSFVLAAADGDVIATSDETEFSALAEIVAGVEGREDAPRAALGIASAERGCRFAEDASPPVEDDSVSAPELVRSPESGTP